MSMLNKGLTPGNKFVYAPLLQPTKEFRLLSFETSSTETQLSCRLQTFNLAECPVYYALSYVYGEPSLQKQICIDGKETYVNEKGWHTLQQARAQGCPGYHYWIDSLCINQSNLEEKAVQVHKIADIFAGAAGVWACFGAHADDSDFLFRTLATFPLPPLASYVHESSDDVQRRTIKWLVSLGINFGRFADALKAFARRSFFTRVWIFQELHLAARMTMICGSLTADMRTLHDITLICSFMIMNYRPQSDYDYKEASSDLMSMMHEADLYMLGGKDYPVLAKLLNMVCRVNRRQETAETTHYSRSSEIIQILSVIQNLYCQDVRDNIFAILSLLGNSCNVVPDYKVSCFNLALRVLADYEPRCIELAILLCINLSLDLSGPGVDFAIAKNQTPHPDGNANPSRDSVILRHKVAPGSQVRITLSGQVTAPFASETVNLHNEPEERAEPQVVSDLLTKSFVDKKLVVADKSVVAIANCELDEGDWIVPLYEYSTPKGSMDPSYGIVLRLQESGIYLPVGEIAFARSYKPCPSWDTCQCEFGPTYHPDFHTTFEINFDHEELLLLAIRLRGPFEAIEKESCEGQRPLPQLPAGLPMKWHFSPASRHDSSSSMTSPPKMRSEPMDQEDATQRLKLCRTSTTEWHHHHLAQRL